LNYLVGDMNPLLFRTTNLALLSLTAVVVTFLVNSFSAVDREPRSSMAGLLAGLFFLVHPLQTYVTLYIWQRSALLACFFYYTALLTYLSVRKGRFRNPYLGHFLSLCLFVAAMLTKENAITLPIILLLAGIAFFRDTWREVLTQGAVYGAVVIACLAFLSAVERAHGSSAFAPGILNTVARYYQEADVSFSQALLAQCRVLFQYVSAILIPTQATVQLVAPQVLTRSLMAPPSNILAVIGCVGLVATGIRLLKKQPLAGFGLLFFLINFVPEALLVPQYQFFGYRAVLPMLGIILVAVELANRAMQHAISERTRRAMGTALLVATISLVLVSANLTMVKADLWSDPVRFWADTVSRFSPAREDMERKPQVQALHNLGVAFQARGSHAEAVPHLERAVNLAPDEVPSLTALGYSYSETDKLSEAERLLRRALQLDGSHPKAHRVLAEVLSKEQRFDEANLHLRKAITLAPEDDDLHDALGRLLFSQNKPAEGEASLREALALNPRSYVSHSNLGAFLLSQGRLDEAIAHLRAALKLRPDYWVAMENMGVAHAVAGRPELAVECLKKAVQLNPDNASARRNLDAALRQLAESRK